MSNVELTHMTSKGQIVIPLDIRREVDAEEGTVFAVFGSGETILLKKVQKPTKQDFLKSWNKLVKESAKKLTNLKVKESDVAEIIHRSRGVKND
ncbi:AbrB/MazE/SpoVT family DNA-binding domain-containing protein [Candidatus Micrarchaeota archaeon]|nr:AbrB/MazE/SpoVT family DNA-binding domain-containing protein [Candidatus Micrarchaeota archaeon]